MEDRGWRMEGGGCLDFQGLTKTLAVKRQYHQKIHVGVRPRLPVGIGSKEDDSGGGGRGKFSGGNRFLSRRGIGGTPAAATGAVSVSLKSAE